MYNEESVEEAAYINKRTCDQISLVGLGLLGLAGIHIFRK
jgi:hypothetical protein